MKDNNGVSGLRKRGNRISFEPRERRTGINWTISLFLSASLSFSDWPGPVQMPSTRVLPPADHGQAEVEVPHPPDSHNYCEICLCSAGDLCIDRGIL
jgi:hypothetical protein